MGLKILICTVSSLILFIIFFILIKRLLNYLIDKRISNFQNELISKQYKEVDNIYKQMRGFKHDFHNHIQVMMAYLDLGKYDEMSRYLNDLNNDLKDIDKVVKTENLMVDAILNTKLSIALKNNININAKAKVPSDIKLLDLDLCTVIGNLMDNAIEAAIKIENKDDRFIRVYIREMKGQLYISVTNSVGGEVKKDNFTYITTKLNSNHGFGLKRIDNVVKKYSGFINRQNEEDVFATEVILPL